MQRNKWIGWLIFGLVLGSIIAIFPPDKKIKRGLDLVGGMHLVLEVETEKLHEGTNASDAVDRALEIIRSRVDQFGVSEPLIQCQGEKWIVVELPEIKDVDRAKKLIGETALLEFKLVDEKANADDVKAGKVPGREILPMKRGDEQREIVLESEQLLTGAALTNAAVRTDGGSFGNEPYIALNFNSDGAEKFAKLTGANVGRKLAIILDSSVYSAPNIKQRIGGGKAVIEGGFTMETAHDLAIVLRAGAMPAPVKIISEEIVGPTLGQDSVHRGILVGIASLLAISLFMIIYYRFSGFIAVAGMIFNMIILMGCIALMKATLTMPGIAGLILTIGMSTDSNVLIFERIREELRLGKTPRAAIAAGYRRVLWTIIDSHVTALIAAIVLFQFGSGPIKGFAVTLSFGLAINVFTAVVVTKAIFDWRSAGQVTEISI